MSRFSLSHRGYVYLCLTFSTLNLCNAWINWQYCNKHKRVAMENLAALDRAAEHFQLALDLERAQKQKKMEDERDA
ncbi:unnamed protein product [Linum tenue]|uniref:Uncharacterized protein n=1 Tax=Linum tenue TaxID=586396 RepID=A0AAV0NP34_9ROSI|nr:unnamed protein product [Linum tenue]CAI0459968.1 unnamed protein product [Linum tenue]